MNLHTKKRIYTTLNLHTKKGIIYYQQARDEDRTIGVTRGIIDHLYSFELNKNNFDISVYMLDFHDDLIEWFDLEDLTQLK